MPPEITSATPPLPARARADRVARWAVRFALSYLIVVGAVTAMLWWKSDDWWPATVLLFGPRWLIALPLLALVPLAAYGRSVRAGGLLLVAAGVAAGPLCGGRLTVPEPSANSTGDFTVRVMTWNCAGASLDHPAFRDFIDAEELDVVVLQEAHAVNVLNLPPAWGKAGGPTGTVVLSHFPLREDGRLTEKELGLPGRADRVILQTPVGPISLVDLHLPTPRSGLEAVFGRQPAAAEQLNDLTARRSHASSVARKWVGTDTDGLIVCGDFNMPVESAIYQRDWSHFGNAFSATGRGWGQTKRTRWYGARIDHILFTAPWVCRAARVGPPLGSDHHPMLAKLVYLPR